MARAGTTRADGVVVTSANSTDEVLLQQFSSTTGQYQPALITVANLFAGGADTPNVNVGASGVAGTLKIFPSTAAKGDLKFVATNNTGNTETTITNAAMAQATVISIPDPLATTATFVLQNKGTGTEASNAVTISKLSGVITTSSLSTAGAGSYLITLTNTYISATSVLLVSYNGGTNTTRNISIAAVPGSGSAAITIYNNTAATALNGTVIIDFFLIP